MGILNYLFGSGSKAADNVLDKDNGLLTQVGNWVGNMNYTDEERAEANQKQLDIVIDYAKSSVSENSERSKARREIAKMWIKLQTYLIMLTAISIPVDKFMGWKDKESLAIQYFQLATSTVMVATTSAIVIFYFGSYGWQRIKESKSK